jgi:hypothetical protein
VNTHPSPFVRGARIAFGILRFGPLLALGAVIIQPPAFSSRVEFAPEPIHVAAADASVNAKVDECFATTFLKSGPADEALVHTYRTRVLPAVAVRLLMWAILWDLLHRICRAVERNEPFSPATFRLVRRVGWALIVFPVAAWAGDLWMNSGVAQFAKAHLAFAGLQVRDNPVHADFNTTLLVVGLLIFVLAEVFRHGSQLQQEADLTV